jgi:hypothetical protein
MKSLIKATHISDNGDSTSTYGCELKRDDITVREFVDAIRRSIHDDKNRVFNEWWASCCMSLTGSTFVEAGASFYMYPERDTDVTLDGAPSTVDDIVEKYGDCIVEKCTWNGGWGSGGYCLKIRNKNGVRNDDKRELDARADSVGAHVRGLQSPDTRPPVRPEAEGVVGQAAGECPEQGQVQE